MIDSRRDTILLVSSPMGQEGAAAEQVAGRGAPIRTSHPHWAGSSSMTCTCQTCSTRLLPSPHAHAVLESVDFEAARGCPL